MADATFTECSFVEAWRGPCRAPSDNGRCSKHGHLVCASCKAPATHDCDYTGQFVCGAPLCDGCIWSTDPDPDRNRGLLFMAHDHVKNPRGEEGEAP